MKIQRDTIVRITLSSDDIKEVIREWIKIKCRFETLLETDGQPIIRCILENDVVQIMYTINHSNEETKP